MSWYDREILAGGEIDGEISKHFDQCDLFLALVSPDFLDSNYCYEREMEKAIQRHEDGTMRIVPIIVEPCDWKSSPLKRFKAVPRDGNPISEWTNQNNAFLDVVTELRRIVEQETGGEAGKTETQSSDTPSNERRKYRIERDFDEIDKSDFLRDAFEVFRTYFEAAVSEIDGISGIKARLRCIGSEGFTCTVVNSALERGVAYITVYAGGRQGMGDLYYSHSEDAPTNTANGGFRIVSDEYDLSLQPWGFTTSDGEERLSPHSAAERLWMDLIERAGIKYE